MTYKSFLGYIGWLSLCILLAAVLAAFIANINVSSLEFDKSGLLSGLIAFTTSATLATFLTLFHSENKRIVFLRRYGSVAASLYLTVILNTALVCIAPLFISLKQQILGIGIDNFVTCLVLFLTLQVIVFLIMLIGLYTKE